MRLEDVHVVVPGVYPYALAAHRPPPHTACHTSQGHLGAVMQDSKHTFSLELCWFRSLHTEGVT